MTDELIFYINTFWFWIGTNKIDNYVYCKSHTTTDDMRRCGHRLGVNHWLRKDAAHRTSSGHTVGTLWAHYSHYSSSASTHLHFHCCAHHKLMKAGATLPLALAQASLCCWRCFEINIDSISLKHTNKPSYHTNQLSAMLDNHALIWVLISTVDQNYVKWMDWYVWNGWLHHEVIMKEVFK